MEPDLKVVSVQDVLYYVIQLLAELAEALDDAADAAEEEN